MIKPSEPVALYEGGLLWGHVRLVQEGGPASTIAHLELRALSSSQWKPFCSLTVLHGHVAFAMTAKAGYTIERAGILVEKPDGDTGPENLGST